MEESIRYFFSSDNDAHWYLVPEARRIEWYAWRDIPEDDERSWDEPEYARRLGTHISLISFLDPQGYNL